MCIERFNSLIQNMQRSSLSRLHPPSPLFKDFIQNHSFITGILNTKGGFFK